MVTAMQLRIIKDCYNSDRKTLQTKLEEFGASSNEEKSAILLKAMGAPNDVFYSCGESSDTESEQYEALVGAFYSGVWLPNSV
jgi:hypothetical protein